MNGSWKDGWICDLSRRRLLFHTSTINGKKIKAPAVCSCSCSYLSLADVIKLLSLFYSVHFARLPSSTTIHTSVVVRAFSVRVPTALSCQDTTYFRLVHASSYVFAVEPRLSYPRDRSFARLWSGSVVENHRASRLPCHAHGARAVFDVFKEKCMIVWHPPSYRDYLGSRSCFCWTLSAGNLLLSVRRLGSQAMELAIKAGSRDSSESQYNVLLIQNVSACMGLIASTIGTRIRAYRNEVCTSTRVVQ